MGSSKVTRIDYDFYKSYIVKLIEQEKERGNKNCNPSIATAILKKRLDQAGGLATT